MFESFSINTSDFKTISLEEMEGVKLLNRIDKKYVFHISKLPAILHELESEYRILEINEKKLHTYETLYYDTKDFEMYRNHHNGKLNRYKVRFRNYIDANESYFEIKFKNNKGRTIKRRIKTKEFIINDKAKELLEEITKYSTTSLEQKLWIKCKRITFTNINKTERLTIDLDLKIKEAGENKNEHSYPNMVIAELKQDKTQHDSKFIRTIRSNYIREGGISKYCFGVYEIFNNIKKNNFKPRVRLINKRVEVN